ncbi:MAG TPA: Uma2 family endonuclease [Verrucomicrobiota bacterium]|nr:Uma2 family endonuclease [Verrucomicrobiota bacterium]
MKITQELPGSTPEAEKVSFGGNADFCYLPAMAAVLEKQAKRWTYEEYYRLDDDQRHEIVDGNLLMAPAPDTWHQSWLNEINIFLSQFIRQRKLGRLFIAPVDVVLDSENIVQPDIVFVSATNTGIIERRGIMGTPDLLVELVSPSSVRRDRYDKKDLYARFGVKEYWIGDPANKSLEILTLKEGRYELHCAAEQKGKLTSLVLAGLEFDLAEIG